MNEPIFLTSFPDLMMARAIPQESIGIRVNTDAEMEEIHNKMDSNLPMGYITVTTKHTKPKAQRRNTLNVNFRVFLPFLA
jgi:hypothetical protein